MAYIGRQPTYGAFEKQSLTADSSTTTFTLNYTVGSSSSILVSVAGVVQEPETGYNLSGGGTSLVFSAAPTTGDTVFVVFLGLARDVADFLSTGVITTQTELSERAASGDFFLIYDTSATSLKKIQASNVVAASVNRTATGDGSTTGFTVTSGVTAAQCIVTVNGVVQQVTTDYSVSGTTLTFGTAPAASDRIQIRELPAQINIDMATKIKNSNLDNTIITGLTTTEDVATTDQAIIYDASTGSLRKITQQNLLGFPTITSVSPTSVNDGDGTGNHTFVITGKALTSGSAALVNTNGATVNFDTVTVNSDTQITGIIAKGSLPGSGEPYDVRVEGSNGLISTLANQININQAPTFNTSAGSLGGVPDGSRATASFDIEAFDPESAGNVSFELQSGSLPAGATTSTVNENGVSKFRIAGTFSAVGSNTTSNFVIRASDAGSNTSSRAFSLQVLAPTSESFTSSGTFSVPSGVSSVNVGI